MELFLRSKESPESYPLNLVRTEVYKHRLDYYVDKLRDDRYFADSNPWRSLFMWDLADKSQGFLSLFLFLDGPM